MLELGNSLLGSRLLVPARQGAVLLYIRCKESK
jgi:hypothetical protein